MANVRAESLGIACAAFWVIALIGFFVIACTGSLAMACTGCLASACIGSFVIALIDFFVVGRAGSLAIGCAGSLVIACTTSFLVSCSGLVRFNVEGASACAFAAALEMTRSDVVANVKQIGPRTEARYAGNRGVRQELFFLFLKEPAHRVRDSQNRVFFNTAAELPLSVPFLGDLQPISCCLDAAKDQRGPSCEFVMPLREIPCLGKHPRPMATRSL